MKRYISKNQTRKLLRFAVCTLLPLAGGWAAASCSDWDDHYDASKQVLDTQQHTLWENIEQNSNLSQFASLLKKTGYDKVLQSSQTFTVWAPTNDSFDYTALNAESESRLLKEFVMNHMARNNYPVSGPTDQRVFMLNEKMMRFNGSDGYQIQDIPVQTANIACGNGTLHTLTGKIPFLPNIYESLNSEQFAIDSISDYFHSYDSRKFDEQNSVAGPILNGEQTYLDSIFYEHNDLFMRNRAYIDREDSNYTMLIPTNEAWEKARQTISKFYNYLPTFEFAENTAAGANGKITTVSLKDANGLRDSMVNVMLMSDLFYNNNILDNGKLNDLQEGQTLRCDSLMSTLGTKIFAGDAALLFENAKRVDKSNGAVWVTDSLRLRPWASWNPEIVQEAESSTMLAGYFNTSAEPVINNVRNNQNPAVEGHVSNGRYLQAPSGLSDNPEVDFYLPSVRSTTYSIYAVIVPANITNVNATPLPHRLAATIGYADEKGKMTEQAQSNPTNGSIYFINDPTRIDTLYLGDFTFPMAFYGTGSYYPYIRLRSRVTNSLSSQYDRTLRIDCLILRPKELDTFLREHPGYKYGND